MKTSGILRGDEAGASSVRPLGLDDGGGLVERRHHDQVEAAQPNPLASEVARLQAELAASESRHSKMLAKAREQGREDALAAFKRDEAAGLATLEKSISTALSIFEQNLASLERMALSLCDTALGKVLGDPARRQDLIEGALREQLALIRRPSVLSVRVSSSDFIEPAALARLAANLGLPPDSIEGKAELSAGRCEILVRLGQIDISIPEYLTELRRVLLDADRNGEAAP